MTTKNPPAPPRPIIPVSTPDSTLPRTSYLVPKGCTLLASIDVRPYPRARNISVEAGTEVKVRYVLGVIESSVNGGEEQMTWHVDTYDGREFLFDFETVNAGFGVPDTGDGIYDETIHADGREWGYYGLDWYYDPGLVSDRHDGYVRLRRMVKVA